MFFSIGGFLLYKNPSAEPRKQIVSSDVSQWPQYTNLNLHYSLRYPNLWKVDQVDENCLPNDSSFCNTSVFLRATSTTPIHIEVLFNKENLNLLDWLSNMGYDTKKFQIVEINNSPGIKYELSYYFQEDDYIYSVSGINPDYFMADYRNNQQQEFINEMGKVISENELPTNFYSMKMTDEQLLLLEEKIVTKVTSTFRILEK